MIFQAFLWCSWVWAMNTLQVRHEIVFGHHMLFYSTFRIGSILLRAVFTPLAVLNRTIILPNVEVLQPVMTPHGPCHCTRICGIVLHAIIIDPVAPAFAIVGTMRSCFVDDSELLISGCSQRLTAEKPTHLRSYPGQYIAVVANGPGQATSETMLDGMCGCLR